MTERTRTGFSLLEGLLALALLALLLVPLTGMMVGENEESKETVIFMQLLDEVNRKKARDPAAASWAAIDEDKVRELQWRRPPPGTTAAAPAVPEVAP